MRRRRMLFVSYMAALGGVESSLSTRMKALRKMGIDCEVLFLKAGSGMDTFAGFPVHVTDRGTPFRKIVRTGRFDLISLINTANRMTVLQRMKYEGKIIYEVRGLISVMDKYCIQLPEAKTHAIVVPSRYVAGLVGRALQGKAIPICVVPNPTDTNLFHPIEQPNLECIPLQTLERPIVLWVGRLDPNKNWPEMLAVAQCLLQRNNKLHFVFAVDTSVVTSQVERFQDDVKVRALEKHVTMLPCVPHDLMPLLYNAVAQSGGCTISTSLSEGLQNSVMEALACGCPVVSSAAGGNPEIVIPGETGLLYRSGEVETAAACVERTMRDELYRQRVIANGLARIEDYHTPLRHAKNFLKAIEDPWGYSRSVASGSDE